MPNSRQNLVARYLAAIVIGAVSGPVIVAVAIGVGECGAASSTMLPLASGYLLTGGVASGVRRTEMLMLYGAAGIACVVALTFATVNPHDSLARLQHDMGIGYGILAGIGMFLVASVGSWASPRGPKSDA